MVCRLFHLFFIALLFSYQLKGGLYAKEKQSFSVVISGTKAAFSGTLESKAMVERLANVLIDARSDLEVINTGLEYDSDRKIPHPEMFESLLVEVALSTHEGELALSDEVLTVGGLTDSVVTLSVLRLRAEPFLKDGRRLRERLCLVPTEDLPAIPIILSTGETRDSFSFDLDLLKTDQVFFEPSGISLLKLGDLIHATKDVYWLETGKTGGPPPPPAVEVAEAIGPETIDKPIEEPVVEAIIPDPYHQVGVIRYGRNSYLYQVGEEGYFKTLAKQLNEKPYLEKSIQLHCMMYKSGSVAFSEWLVDKRKAKAIEKLVSLGVEKNRIQAEVVETDQDDIGEVKVRVLKSMEQDQGG